VLCCAVSLFLLIRLIVGHLRKKVEALSEPAPPEPTLQHQSEEEAKAAAAGMRGSVQQVLTLCCQECGGALARESAVFQVPGADGTVGAYVNPHGCVAAESQLQL
jgi:hypothetical protein